MNLDVQKAHLSLKRPRTMDALQKRERQRDVSFIRR
jgi:hypothetical protein